MFIFNGTGLRTDHVETRYGEEIMIARQMEKTMIDLLVEKLEEDCSCQTCQAKEKDQFKCIDCDVDTMNIDEYYMLKDKAWLSIVPEDKGVLCIGCVEDRMGRKLTQKDFSSCILNKEEYSQPRSDRLLDRMGYLKTVEV